MTLEILILSSLFILVTFYLFKLLKPMKSSRIFVFGYGSLINSKSRRKTTGKLSKAYPIKVKNLERHWNCDIVADPKKKSPLKESSRVLGVVLEKGKYCNGIITQVTKKEFKEIDKRESMYYKHLIKLNEISLYDKDALTLTKGDKVYVYVPNKSDVGMKFPIHQSYLDVCLFGCFEFGKEFVKDFIKDTVGWSNLSNDRNSPIYLRAMNYNESDGEGELGILRDSDIKKINQSLKMIPKYHKSYTQNYELLQ